MNRTLIVARMDPDDTEAVAKIFAESDASELPRLIGVSHRALFSFHGLYFHLIEAPGDVTRTLPKLHDHPLFRDVNDRLAAYVRPYDPGWREPKDAVAHQFYSWSAPN